MARDAWGILKLGNDPRYIPALRRLESFSHVWLIFVFHKTSQWHPIIDSPRLEAEEQIGVFASRSPHRPNPLGLSAVKLEKIDALAEGGPELHFSGVDILDGTPILDIKPYLPYADRVDDANAGWADQPVKRYSVRYSPESLQTLNSLPSLKNLVEQLLEWDPRPTSQRRAAPFEDPSSEGAHFAFRFLDWDIQWEIRSGTPYVQRLVPLASGTAE
jgi:tRNA-Thr(GGU) m(6)t(6)A37 methyltransferase TsaA